MQCIPGLPQVSLYYTIRPLFTLKESTTIHLQTRASYSLINFSMPRKQLQYEFHLGIFHYLLSSLRETELGENERHTFSCVLSGM